MNSKMIISQIRSAIKDTEFAGKTFLVGGFVRDQLMGNFSDDLDLVVALPDGGRKLARFLHEKSISSRPVIYDNFGTALIEIGGKKVELVMARKESYRDKDRKPEVENGSLQEDVFRRDFTINSLLQDIISDEIFDISGKGKKDIQAGIIRSTSSPDVIFREDPLRMLRAVRLANRFNFSIEAETITGILQNSTMLRHISWERRRDELEKMLLQDEPDLALTMLVELNLMQHIVPELLALIGLEQGARHDRDAWQHTLQVIRNIPPKIELRLAALLHDIGKPLVKSENATGIHFYRHEQVGARLAADILNRLKFPKEMTKQISQMIRFHMRLKYCGPQAEKLSDKALRKLLWQTRCNCDDLLQLIHADNLSHHPSYNLKKQIPQVQKRIKAIQTKFEKSSLPLTGKDIILYLKLKPGKEIGKLLDTAADMWLENPDMSRDDILRKLERRIEMENKESKISQKVKDGVIKAYHAGEDIVKAVGNVTKEVISTTKNEELNNKEKAQKLAKEALEGAKEGFNQVKPPVTDFARKASKTISDNFKAHAPTVAHFVKDVFEGIVDGAKEVIDETKKKSCCEEDEEENK